MSWAPPITPTRPQDQHTTYGQSLPAEEFDPRARLLQGGFPAAHSDFQRGPATGSTHWNPTQATGYQQSHTTHGQPLTAVAEEKYYPQAEAARNHSRFSPIPSGSLDEHYELWLGGKAPPQDNSDPYDAPLPRPGPGPFVGRVEIELPTPGQDSRLKLRALSEQKDAAHKQLPTDKTT
jgi:hypothetical protein